MGMSAASRRPTPTTATDDSVEVPRGYKRTEVGVIPEDWGVKSIAELAQIKTGPFGTLLKAEEYSGKEGVPLISVGEIGAGSFTVSEATPRVPPEVIRRLPQYLLRAGDIVFGRKGAVDRSALVTRDEEGWFLGSDGISIRPLRSCFAPYLAWQFQRHEVQSWLLQNAVGTTMASLNQCVLSQVRVPYAPPPEQRAIAEALSDVDGLLGALKALIAKKRAIKQAAMQQLLTGKTRLPGLSGPWETKRLGEIGRFRGGTGFPTSMQGVTSGKYPFFKVSDMNNEGNETFMDVANNYISEETRRVLGATAFPAKSIVFAKVGAAVFLERKKLLSKASCLDNNMAAFVLDGGDADYRFIHYVFLNTTLGDLVSTTALPSLSGRVLCMIECLVPPIDEQTAIATVLSEMDAEIAALERRRDKTSAIKQGMMQQLLTGRVRLVEPEVAA